MKSVLAAITFAAVVLSLQSAAAGQTTDSSIVTGKPEQRSDRGGRDDGSQKITLRIPVGTSLSRVFVAHGKWITGLRLEFANGKSQGWGSGDDSHEQSVKFKPGEYVEGVRVHVEAHVDWIDFVTSKNRILHVGRAKTGTPQHGTDVLKIPDKSRVTGLLLYVDEHHYHEIQGIEALYQPAE